MSQHLGHSTSRNMVSGRPRPPPELASQQQYLLDPLPDFESSQSSAPFSQYSLSQPTSQYTMDGNPQEPALAPMQYPPFQQYTGTQAVYQNSRPPYHLTATTPNGHPVSHQRYSERDCTTSFRGAGGPVFGDDLRNHNGGNSGWSSMGDSSRQNVRGSFIEPYYPNSDGDGYSQAQHLTEHRTMDQTNGLTGRDSWKGFPVQYRIDATSENFGMRVSPSFCSATDNHGAGGEIDNQNWTLATTDINIGPGSQWSDPQEMGNQANPSTIPPSGIDLSLIDGSFSAKYNSFLADLAETDPGGSDAQNEMLLCNPDHFDNSFLNGSPTSTFSGSGTVSRKARSRATSNTTPHSHRRAHPVSSEPLETRCKACDDDPDCEDKPVYRGTPESQKTSLGRHMREHHSDSKNWSYQCLLDKDGSACKKVIRKARGRRKHVETVHPTESRNLPPKDAAKRNSNVNTNAMLDEWFDEIPRTSSP